MERLHSRQTEFYEAISFAFNQFDKNGESEFDPQLIADLEAENPKSYLENDEVQDIIVEFKKLDKNGKVDYEEYVDLIQDSLEDEKKMKKALEFAFSIFDEKKNGLITADSFKDVMNQFGAELTNAELKEMMDQMAFQNDNEINFEDFMTKTEFFMQE